MTLDNGTFIVVNRDLSKGVSMPEIAKNIKVKFFIGFNFIKYVCPVKVGILTFNRFSN